MTLYIIIRSKFAAACDAPWKVDRKGDTFLNMLSGDVRRHIPGILHKHVQNYYAIYTHKKYCRDYIENNSKYRSLTKHEIVRVYFLSENISFSMHFPGCTHLIPPRLLRHSRIHLHHYHLALRRHSYGGALCATFLRNIGLDCEDVVSMSSMRRSSHRRTCRPTLQSWCSHLMPLQI